ncbi:MAG: flagellar biosynthesis regulator FlaF [Alphaproteobacteria bacterium]|nr:flagellar biosynthesis regulator FlaF [Alphaproteobacteria bacterium]
MRNISQMNLSQSYTQNEVSGMGQAELESRALIRTASALNQIKEHWEERKGELEDALEKNRKLWAIIASAMQEGDCPQPKEVRKNILSLAMFVFQRTVDTIASPEPRKLDVLISINLNIAKGLSGDGA